MQLQQTISKLVVAASFLGSCSAPQEAKEQTPMPCETQAQELEKTMSDVNMMLTGAGFLIDLASRGDTKALRQAQDLRPKVHEKLIAMKTQRAQLREFCPKEYYMPSGQGGLKGTSRFDMQIAPIRKMIQDLKGYTNVEITQQ